jgi:hypothetical protein
VLDYERTANLLPNVGPAKLELNRASLTHLSEVAAAFIAEPQSPGVSIGDRNGGAGSSGSRWRRWSVPIESASYERRAVSVFLPGVRAAG